MSESTGVTNHFAAGVLLAAVALELVPRLAAASEINDMVAIVVGFILGVALMAGLEYAVYDEDAADFELREMKERMTTDTEAPEPSESGRSTDSGSVANKTSKTSQAQNYNKKNSKKSAKTVVPSFPIAFAVAVYIDSAVDGPQEPRHEGRGGREQGDGG
jgi:hypothetical protein